MGRVIARPFTGTYPDFTRTQRRHDFSLVPPRDTILDQLQAAGREVIGVGKIYDIFAGKGIDRTTPNHGNHANMERVFEIMKEEFDGLCYVNLVDTDMIYGHRRDIPGYAGALSECVVQLGLMLPGMKEDDILIITADPVRWCRFWSMESLCHRMWIWEPEAPLRTLPQRSVRGLGWTIMGMAVRSGNCLRDRRVSGMMERQVWQTAA